LVQLQRPKVSTPEDAKILRSIHETGALLVGDLFLPNYINECIRVTEGLGNFQKIVIANEAKKRGTDAESLARLLAQIDDTIKWAGEIRGEGYHQIHTLSFLSEWSAQEAGIENVIAAILETIADAGTAASARFAVGRYSTEDWPWSNEKCLEIAQKLDQKAKEKTPDGGWNIAERMKVLFGWLGVKVEIPSNMAAKYNEASMIRNVIVHRYGRLGSSDANRAPHLNEWIGKTVPMSRERLGEYHNAIIAVHLAIMNGVIANGWK